MYWLSSADEWSKARDIDFTPPEDPDIAPPKRADDFLSCLKNELIPFVETTYPVDLADRCLIGYSRSGEFTLYALLHEPDLFQRYFIGSTIWESMLPHYLALVTCWQQSWVVDCRAVGSGKAALKYLAPYIFRVAISNKRIVRVADGQVTFRYRVSESGRTAYCTLPAHEFVRQFVQHILPKGFVKVRYYGLFHLSNRRSLSRLRSQLQLLQLLAGEALPTPGAGEASTRVVSCPNCGAPMRLERVLLPHTRGPPQFGQVARVAKARQVQARSEMACHAPVCFGAPWRGGEGRTQLQCRPRPVCECATNQCRRSNVWSWTACVRVCEAIDHW